MRVCGGGASSFLLHTYGKRMEMAAESGSLNEKGHKRAVAVTCMPHLWRENEHLRLPLK